MHLIRLPSERTTGLILAALVTGLSLLSFWYTPFDWAAMASPNRFLPPGWPHLLGTDNFGRDIWSRILVGGRYTLGVAATAVVGSSVLGAALGLAAGYAGGIVDEVVMRLMDTLSSFPGVLLALVLVSVLPDRGVALIGALVVIFVPGYVRILRTGTLEYRDRDFVKAVALMGASHGRILVVHILPNIMPRFLSAAVLGVANAILAEATLSYLGLGIQPPLPSWGRMLAESQHFLFNAPWCALGPGCAIMLTVFAFSLCATPPHR